MKEEKNLTITISYKSILLVTLIPLSIYILWFVRDLIFSLLIAFIIMSALRPGVAYLVAKKFPRGAAVGIIYLFFVLVFGSLISVVIPPIVVEMSGLVKNLPAITQNIFHFLNVKLTIGDLSSYVPNVTNNVFGFISSVFSNTLFVITTLFFALYFLLEEGLISEGLHHYFKKEEADKLTTALARAENRMASWFWGEIALMTIVGLGTYVGLVILGVKYALPLAVLAGLLEIVPNIGPVISAVPAIIIGLSQSYFIGIGSLILYIIVQQLENSLIVPMIMKRAVGLNPILTLVALLLGGRTGGVLGVLLAIPILLFVETIISEYSPIAASLKNEQKSVKSSS